MASPTLGATGDDERRNQQLLQELSELSKLCDDAFHGELESNRADKDELQKILNVLEEIKTKIPPPPPGDGGKKVEDDELPPSKKEELAALLPTIKRALEKRRPPAPPSEAAEQLPPAAERTKAGCGPFKLRPPPQQRQAGGGGGGRREEEEDEVPPLKVLLRLAEHVLEPEEYYEWTTSYVDESRIFGWDKEAGEVVDALVAAPTGGGGGGGQRLFRVAGIAGIHGSGKTALAQKVFVHDGVKDHFPVRLWVCVGPPDSEDRFCLLYRMLDNLGLDTHKVEFDIVDKCKVVADHRKEEEARIRRDPKAMADVKKKAAELKDAEKKKPEGAAAGEQPADAEDADFKKALRETVESSDAVQRSKIGVLLYILHQTLSKTGYLIVFDDIRVYGGDGWYSNLALEPPAAGEWGDRLAYGLPKTGEHRSAVLVTCRREEDARAMVRAGRVFRPPRLEVDQGWELFRREYGDAKTKKLKDGKSSGGKREEDARLKELEEMKAEIVHKCLGLPVAIIEAAKGFALSDLEPLPDPPKKAAAAAKKSAEDQAVEGNKNPLKLAEAQTEEEIN
ncbi:hypothetical protein ACP4OV_012010 [Aristida adscensionis]